MKYLLLAIEYEGNHMKTGTKVQMFINLRMLNGRFKFKYN